MQDRYQPTKLCLKTRYSSYMRLPKRKKEGRTTNKKLAIMRKRIKRKEFEKLFLSFDENGKQIWVISRVKVLPFEIVNMALKLAELDFLNYIRICDETLSASSENYPKRPKVPITRMNHPTAIGIQILYSPSYKTIDFFDINSPNKGKRK